MTLSFLILGALLLGSAIAAMTLRGLVHCALALTVAFAGLGACYLQLGAQFAGFAQILVYVGAVAILLVFAILITRGTEPPLQPVFSASWAVGVAVALAVMAVLAGAIVKSPALRRPGAAVDNSPAPSATVLEIGNQLMTRHLLALEILGLLLTAALIGAVIIAMNERKAR
jgi:NADH:ubiquinone oxidoreductase subunit 6 (subunit J)